MKKAFLLVVVLVGVGLLVPRSREQLVQLVGPFSQAGQRRSAERQLEKIVADIQSAERETGAIPEPGMFAGWLTQRNHRAEDPWSSRYYFEVYADSFVVGSPGPDARIRTDDDLRRAGRLKLVEPGVLIVDYAPAPPPSSATGTAKSKAMEAAKRQ